MTALVMEAALRSLLLAMAVWIALELLRVRNVLAEKTAWILVLAAAVLMPAMLVLAARFPALPALRLALPAIAFHAPARAAAAKTKQPEVVRENPERVFLQRPKGTAPAAKVGGAVLSSGAAEESSLQRSRLSKPLDPPGLGLSEGTMPAANQAGIDGVAQNQARLAAAHSAESGARAPRRLTLTALAAMLYLLIAFALCLRLLLGIAVTLRVWRSATPVNLEPAEAVRLRSSDQVTAPVTIGSGILLPMDYSAWGEEKLRIVLAHERSHVRQGDFYLQLLASLYAALLWLSPLGWWLKRKLSDLGEAIGDRSGLEAAQSRTAYARVLLEFAAAPRPTLLGVAMARPSSLSRRMERLLNESAFRQAFSSHGRAFAAALLLPAVFFAASALVRVEAASEPTGQKAVAQAQAQRQAAKAQELSADQAQRDADTQAQAASAQQVSADEAQREAEAATASAEAQAAGSSQASGDATAPAAPLAGPAPFDPPVIRMQVPDGLPARIPDGVRTVIVEGSTGDSVHAFGKAGDTLALLGGGHAWVQSGNSAAEAAFDRTLSFSGNLDLHVATGCGNIHLKHSAAGQLVVHGDVHTNKAEEADEVRSLAANPPIEQEGNVVRIGAQHDENPHNHICIDYEIQAPADAALNAISGSGDIVDEGVGHGAKLMTGSGNINATGLEGGFTTQTGSGDIAIENTGEGDAKAQTGSGNIDVKGVHGALKAETGSGDIKAEGTPSTAWKLETGSGSVEFSPGGAGLTLDASAGSGSISTDHPASLQVSSDRHHVSGQLNGGGPDVHIETGSGDIRIHD